MAYKRCSYLQIWTSHISRRSLGKWSRFLILVCCCHEESRVYLLRDRLMVILLTKMFFWFSTLSRRSQEKVKSISIICRSRRCSVLGKSSRTMDLISSSLRYSHYLLNNFLLVTSCPNHFLRNRRFLLFSPSLGRTFVLEVERALSRIPELNFVRVSNVDSDSR